VASAITLIIAGTGEITEDETFDLLDNAYPEAEFAEIGVVVPVDKDLYSKAVENVVAWFNNDKDIYPIQTKGASMTRGAARLGDGTQEVEKFTDILDPKEFEEWDEVHVLLAMPEDPESDEYDFYAEVADVALQAGFVVKDLTAGLDDIVVTDPEDATAEAPEPEPEPEQPARRSRRRAAKEEAEATPEPEEEEKATRPSRRAKKADTVEEVQEAVKAPEAAPEPSPASDDYEARIFALEEQVQMLIARLRSAGSALTWEPENTEPAKEAHPAEEAKEDAPKRGRGRPRTQFDVKQVLDEDTDEWVPRPAGRLRKDTKWRTIHSETGDVLEEGTA
jgi:hypothetical protein